MPATVMPGTIQLTSGVIPRLGAASYGLPDTSATRGESSKEHQMEHIRIATYKQTAGTFEDLCAVIQAPGGLADVFRASPGFIAYTFARLDDGTNCSISVWTSEEAAEAATAAARTWVAANVADMGRLTADHTGHLGFIVGELAPALA